MARRFEALAQCALAPARITLRCRYITMIDASVVVNTVYYALRLRFMLPRVSPLSIITLSATPYAHIVADIYATMILYVAAYDCCRRHYYD